jgi:hypothetical protein
MRRANQKLVLLTLWAVAVSTAGCGTACGPVCTVPAQRLRIEASSPASYTVRVRPSVGDPIDTPVPPDGRLTFDVPVTSRASTIYCFMIPVYRYPPPDTLRVIQVMRDGRLVRKLSAQDIARLPVDAEGYHALQTEK